MIWTSLPLSLHFSFSSIGYLLFLFHLIFSSNETFQKPSILNVNYLPLFQNLPKTFYIPSNHNATNCEGLPQVPSCPEGYTLIQDPVTGQDVCQLLYTEEPIILATEQFNYGAGIAIGTDLGFGNNGTARYGIDWPIVIDDVFTDVMPTNQADPNTWHYGYVVSS